MQSGRVAPVDNSRKEERRGEKGRGEKEGKKGEREEEERGEKRSPLTMGSRDFGPLTS